MPPCDVGCISSLSELLVKPTCVSCRLHQFATHTDDTEVQGRKRASQCPIIQHLSILDLTLYSAVMEIRSVAMSTKKTDFFKALGLNVDDPWHRRLYQLMNVSLVVQPGLVGKPRCPLSRLQEETEVVWESLVSNRSNRRQHSLNKPEPYSYGDFTEAAIEEALRKITQNASPATRPFFESDPDSSGDRWAVRWLLYHIFRNRDARNRTRSRNIRAARNRGAGRTGRASSSESNSESPHSAGMFFAPQSTVTVAN